MRPSASSFAAALLLAACPTLAQQVPDDDGGTGSRADELAASREARISDVEPAKKSKVVGFLATAETDGIDQLIPFQAGDFRFGFGHISPISSLTPALHYEKPRIGQSELSFQLSGAYSIRGYQAYTVKLGLFDGTVPAWHEDNANLGLPFDFDRTSQEPLETFLYGEGSYRNFPQERFWGLGMDSREDDRTDYRHEVTEGGIVGGYQPHRGIGFIGRAGFLGINVADGTDDGRPNVDDVFDETTAPGVTQQEDSLYFGGEMHLSYLGDKNNPGAQLGLGLTRFDDTDGERFQFNRMWMDARGFLPLGSRQRVLAVRAYLSTDDADAGSGVPFYLMQSFGGSRTVRGYLETRFRDRNQLLVQAEYRWEAAAGLELAAFYDKGKTFDQGGSFDFDDTVDAWGFGIRARSKWNTFLRLDIGKGDEGTFVYFKFGPSF